MFYVLLNPTEKDGGVFALTDYVSEDPLNTGEALRCELCGHDRSMLPWLPPYRVSLEPWTNRFGDIAFGGTELLVTEELMFSFRESGLTGLKLLGPVEIAKVVRRGGARPSGPPPPYLCVRPVYSNTRSDPIASGRNPKRTKMCDACLTGFEPGLKRVVIVEPSWTGEDIFFAVGMSGRFITSERFKTWFDQNEVNNGLLVPCDEYAEDEFARRIRR